MASWSLSSQLILLALFSWNVYSYPTIDWTQHNPEGPNMAVDPGLRNTYSVHPRASSLADPSVEWVTARPPRKHQPSLQSPGVSWPVGGGGGDPQRKMFPASSEKPVSWSAYIPEVLPGPPSNPEGPEVSWVVGGGVPHVELTHPPSAPQGPGMSWSVSAGTDVSPPHSSASDPKTVAEPTYAQWLSSNQFGPSVNMPPFDSSSGPQQEVAEQEGGMLPPLGYLKPNFQGGHLSTESSVFEHGNSEQETEGRDFARMSPDPSAQMFSPLSAGNMESVGPIPNLFYLFLTGQLPPGTVSHVQTDYAAGRDHTTQVGYEEYQSATPENLDIPQVQAPMDWQMTQDFHGLKGF